MNTGLPRHITVTAMPVWIGARSTSVLASASTSRAGFIDAMKGQAMAPTPTAAKAVAVNFRKSRFVPSAGAGVIVWVAISAMISFLILPRPRCRPSRPLASRCV